MPTGFKGRALFCSKVIASFFQVRKWKEKTTVNICVRSHHVYFCQHQKKKIKKGKKNDWHLKMYVSYRRNKEVSKYLFSKGSTKSWLICGLKPRPWMWILRFCSAKLLHDTIIKQTDSKGDQITLFLWTLKVPTRWAQLSFKTRISYVFSHIQPFISLWDWFSLYTLPDPFIYFCFTSVSMEGCI